MKNYKIIYETFYKDYELSANEIALFVILISNKDTFKPNYDYLMKRLSIGKTALRKASKGLQEKGYLKIIRNGAKSEWKISQTKEFKK